jgi:hypothetical protein
MVELSQYISRSSSGLSLMSIKTCCYQYNNFITLIADIYSALVVNINMVHYFHGFHLIRPPYSKQM